MKITSSTIAELLRHSDIEGYIELGAPRDEYDSEAEALALSFSELGDQHVTVDSITSIIREVWRESFNLNDTELQKRKNIMQDLAKNIVNLNTNKS